jgi:hypothetical protein
MDPADLAATTAAFERGYADADERQRYYQQHAGVPAGWDAPPHPDDWYRRPRGLGYSNPPPEIAVFQADEPSPVPAPVPVPLAFDASAPPSVTGSSHAWGQVPGPDTGNPGGGLVYLGLGDTPRRSLLDRLLGRRR